MDPEFPERLHELVERAKEIRRKGIHGVDPEEYTKQHLIEPLLNALGYDSDDIRKEFHILGDQCDYLLETRRPLLFVEAKNLLDRSKDIFASNREQVLRYLRNYRVSPEQVRMEKPVTWLLLTNFAQLQIVRVNEGEPTFSFSLKDWKTAPTSCGNCSRQTALKRAASRKFTIRFKKPISTNVFSPI